MIALLHGAPAFGAVERYVEALVRGLRSGGEEVALLYPRASALAPFDRLAGGGVRTISFAPELLVSTPRLVRLLTRTLRQLEPQAAHVTDVWPAAQVAARLAGVPRLLVTHHTPELPRRDNLAGRLWWRLGWLARPQVVYTSEADRRADGRRPSHVIPLGIDVERFAAARPALAKEGRIVGTVGRLAPQKGQRYLVEAAPLVLDRHPDVRFVVVGGGGLEDELRAQASALGVAERFTFTGERQDVPELLASFDVFALPSLFEGLCLAVVEAQAAGVPVVATPVGGVIENVVPGQTGVLADPGDAWSLADGIVWLLEHPDERARLAATARERALSRFALDRMVERTLALYSRPRRRRACA